ncbi:MAG TPA: type VI secretion system tip protein TssI/VgrG, partial [Planctomycetota bacterium]|nr:type VI secretion system tip protein TssI/VgrG [Planctomycetota bacterium]
MPETTTPVQFLFHSDAVGDDTFLVEAFKFEEEMSTPFTLEVTLLTKKKPESIKPEDMIKNETYLEMKHAVALKNGQSGITTRRVYGMVSSFEMVEKVREFVRCRVVMVPRLWKLSLTKGSRVFQEMDIQELVGAVLKDSASHKFTADDFEFKLGESYSKNEFVTQYNETDLDFVHRWLECEGIYYYLTHSEETKDKVVFADSPEGYLSSIGSYRYRTPGELQSQKADGPLGAEETVRKFVCRMSKLPASVKVRDYNYRTPSVQDEAKVDVEESSGVGTVYEYGDHFKTPSEGAAVATVRAQAIRCREKVFEGKSDVRPLRPGAVFTLEEHFNPDFNGDYVVTSVSHRMRRPFSEAGILSNVVEYDNDFECIKSDIVFRPERTTKWPVLLMINATIDAGGSGDYAEIDDMGRYKVKLPFDCSDKKDGKASRWIRMAQPYAGAEMGMHFPLHKGTEVLLTFIDGDPDRPIISAAVPNPETSSPVQGSNQTQCAIHTG